MKNATEKVHSTVSEKRVKLHIFEPSNRKIWTVVGKEKEYWLSPEMSYCSCPSYYFGIGVQKKCYHLESTVFAKKENKIEEIRFSDDEFNDFLASLISDL